MEEVETLVIGGGIMGVSCAFFLAAAGREVLVVDQREIGAEASGTNAGSLATQNKPAGIVRMSMAGVAEWAGLGRLAGADFEYRRSGGLRVAEDERGAEKLRAAAELQSRLGLEVFHVSGDEARAIAPYLSRRVVAANWCPSDGQCNARTATQLLAKAAAGRGARFAPRRAALGISRDRGQTVRVETQAGPVRAARLVIAAGVWSQKVAAHLGVKLQIRLRINQMMVTEATAPILRHIITHIDGVLTVKQLNCGTVLVGGGWQGWGDLERNVKGPAYESMLGNGGLAARVIPALVGLNVIRGWAGFDGRTADELPIIGPVPGWPGVFLATSCFGGFTVGPLVGRLTAEMVASGKVPPEVADFTPARYLS